MIISAKLGVVPQILGSHLFFENSDYLTRPVKKNNIVSQIVKNCFSKDSIGVKCSVSENKGSVYGKGPNSERIADKDSIVSFIQFTPIETYT